MWDLDGTFVDSEEYHWRSWLLALRDEGFTPTRAQFTATFGQRNDRILRAWLGTGATDDRIRRIGSCKEVEYLHTSALTALADDTFERLLDESTVWNRSRT